MSLNVNIDNLTPTQSANLLMEFLAVCERIHSYIGAERQLTCPKCHAVIIETVYEEIYPGHFTKDYRIRANGRVIEGLGWDEMLGTIAAFALTGKLHYGGIPEDSYDETMRIRKSQDRLGPLLYFPEGETSRRQINWDSVNL